MNASWRNPGRARSARVTDHVVLVLDLLEREHILVHPGYFFDFPREAFLVMSLLPETATFGSATEQVLSHVTERLSIRS